MNALLRIGAAAFVPVLLHLVGPPPAAARDSDGPFPPGRLEAPWIESDAVELPWSDRAEVRLPPAPRLDRRWIQRLNARSAGQHPLAPGGFGIVPRVAGAPRLPAEFEPQEALLLPAGLLADEDPKALIGLVAAMRRRTAVVGIVADADQQARVEQQLRARGLPATSIQFVELAHNTKWVRDYGPIFVRTQNGQRVAVDTEYPELGREEDDVVPSRLAGRFRAEVIAAPIVFEGGNLLSNGCGTCVTTTAAVFRNSDKEDAEARVMNVFRDCFGANQTVFLEPLMGEPTGHVDMFACFTAPDTVVVGAYDPSVDPMNAVLLDCNAARLAGLPTPLGPLRVVRVPMPPHQDGHWRTYTNVVFANNAVLVPTYRGVDRAGRERALDTFAQLMLGWKIIGIDCTTLIQGGGALRCVSAGVPLSGPRAAAIPHRAIQRAPASLYLDRHPTPPAWYRKAG